MSNIRKAEFKDISRLAEIEIFNYRLNFYPIFKNDWYYFDELRVDTKIEEYRCDSDTLTDIYVYDDGAVKGFIKIVGEEVEKLFIEPILQGQSLGTKLLEYAIQNHKVTFLWALEKNTRAISFYERHGFRVTDDKKIEEGTAEYLVRLVR